MTDTAQTLPLEDEGTLRAITKVYSLLIELSNKSAASNEGQAANRTSSPAAADGISPSVGQGD